MDATLQFFTEASGSKATQKREAAPPGTLPENRKPGSTAQSHSDREATVAEGLPEAAYSFLERPVAPIKTVPRQRPQRHKAAIVQERGFETIHTLEEMVAEFPYRPVACTRDYRVVVVRKRLAIEKRGVRIREEYRYFFFITNDRAMPADQVVLTAGGRCDQENLIAQLKGGVHALGKLTMGRPRMGLGPGRSGPCKSSRA